MTRVTIQAGTIGGTASVIGGGPGGLMAAEVLASAGVQVTVYEHMASVGRKLLLAGRSGLNLTNAETVDEMLPRFGDQARHLEPALRRFGPDQLRAWSAGLGEGTFVGSSGRVFPDSLRATPLLRAWLGRLDQLGVTIVPRCRWVGWVADPDGRPNGRRLRFERRDGTRVEVDADVAIFALGGASWPRVGSDGGWVEAFEQAGVQVTDLRPSNCGLMIAWSPPFASRFAGVPVKNVAIGVGDTWVRGDVMITDDGLEGAPVYAMTPAIRDAIDHHGRGTVVFDLTPDLDRATVAERLTDRRPKDSVANWLRRALGLSPAAIGVLRESTRNDVPTDPQELAIVVKAAPLCVERTAPIDRAISTAGGVSFAEVDDTLMLNRMPGTFIVGEMLDWEAPTGGYLLQATFSTAVMAATGALTWLDGSTR